MKVQKLFGTFFMLLLTTVAMSQEKTITGTVIDQTGIPLPGVNIVVEGTSNGTQTDFDGNYSITGNVGQALLFTYLGQKTERRVIGASNVIDLQMEEDAQALQEVVVIGYGNQEEKKIIQNVGIVKQETYNKKGKLESKMELASFSK